MTKIASNLVSHATKVTRVRDLAPPHWVQHLVGEAASVSAPLSRVDREHFTLVTARVAGAAKLKPKQLEDNTFKAYVSIAKALAKSPRRHAIRFWNHVPFINDPADAGRDNYMVFNAGRFRAFSDWFGGPAHFERDVATASGIGHEGEDLVVHCLATDAVGSAVNNPRQVAPYHYSQRFGPLPPCFARATRLAHPKHLLLVGGTASVRGEDSVHIDDLPAQCTETFTNLASLIATAVQQKASDKPRIAAWLSAFTELRVYFPNESDATPIEQSIRRAFPKLQRLELMRAGLCRAELLVEIEGLADLSLLPKS